MATDITSTPPGDAGESIANGNAGSAAGQPSMSTIEERPKLICERCDQESARLSESREADDRVRRVCWSCLYRTEKGINVNRRWQRSRRG